MGALIHVGELIVSCFKQLAAIIGSNPNDA